MLSAESYLKYSQYIYNHNPTETTDNIHKRQPYQDKYLAEIQYELITKYSFEELKEECINFAKKYQDNPYKKQDAIDSCNFYITMLENQAY